jgi:ElaB/YqjD/DUF883 family membrane-anchored ribosome-binding protein
MDAHPAVRDARCMRWATLVLVLAAFAFLGAGCGSSKPSAQEAQAKLCSELKQVRATLKPVLNPSSETTVGDVKNVRDKLESELGDLADAAKDVKVATQSQLDSAAKDLQDSLKSIPDSATLSEAAMQVASSATAFAGAVKKTVAGIDCSS